MKEKEGYVRDGKEIEEGIKMEMEDGRKGEIKAGRRRKRFGKERGRKERKK